MQGRAFLGAQSQPPRDYAFAIRDRMAEWYDGPRGAGQDGTSTTATSCPTCPGRPFTSYTLTMPTAQVCTRLHEQGKLNPVQDRYFQPKPTEELYDMEADPHMIHNLAGDPQHADVLERMRQELHQWQLRTRDLGLISEYEMHRRAADSTQYELVRATRVIPLTRILPVAELAGQRDAENLPDCWNCSTTTSRSSAGGPRWGWSCWAKRLAAASPRWSNAWLTSRRWCASPQPRDSISWERGPARAALVEALAHETPFVRLRALNVLYRMGADARPAVPAIKQASIKGIFPAEYVNRMVEYLPERLEK